MEATMTAVPKVVTKKKKTRMFETYMLRIVKKISESNGITNNAKQQLNSIVSSLAKLISEKAIELTEISKKKTMSDKEVRNAIKIIFPNDFSKNIVILMLVRVVDKKRRVLFFLHLSLRNIYVILVILS